MKRPANVVRMADFERAKREHTERRNLELLRAAIDDRLTQMSNQRRKKNQ